MWIYLLRHGRTEYNAQKRYQGQRDIPLSPESAAQLRRADFSPEVVYVTPLQRTSQTAKILFPDAKLVPVEGLKEMNFGRFEGQKFVRVEQDPEYLEWVWSSWRTAVPRWPQWSGSRCRTRPSTHGAAPTQAAMCWMPATGRRNTSCTW